MRTLITGLVVGSLAISPVVGYAAETENKQQSEALRKYMKENFGYAGMETSWYRQIISLSVQGKRAVVSTRINRKGGAGKEAAKGICSAVSGYVFANQNRGLGIEHIQVLGTDGGVVVSRLRLGDRCEVR
jgi:hypothetical protein